jgi:hypothetical protein
VVVAIVLLAAGLVAVLSGGRRVGELDPRAADPSGSRALAEVLRGQGVQVRLVRTTAAVRSNVHPGDTLLVAFPGLLRRDQTATVRATGADLVVLAPTRPGWFAPGVRLTGSGDREVRDPACPLTVATRAGRADSGGLTYRSGTSATAVGCYARHGTPSLLVVRDRDRRVTFLGNPAALTNDRLDDEGNAALALGLLGSNDRLVWYLPSLSDLPRSAQRSFYSLVPDGVWWGLGEAVVAVLLFAAWRARRLGPLVPEPLPVVVRAAEAVEGRARLYRRGGARDRAAEALRDGTRRRLSVGLPARSGRTDVVDTVARRSGRTATEVGSLLYGAVPRDDGALVRLADDLERLERDALQRHTERDGHADRQGHTDREGRRP